MQPPKLLKRIWKVPRRWRKRLAIHLGLAPKPADRGYMVCTSGRSGSTYLCRLLTSTGMLGRPREFFDYRVRVMEYPDYPKHPRNQIKRIRTLGATANGIYGVKVFPTHLNRTDQYIDALHALPQLSFVRLIRRDILGTAISAVRAKQTHRFSSQELERHPPVYDERRIRRALENRLRHDEYWSRLFEERGIQPLILEYETLAREPQAAVDAVATLMGIALPVPIDFAKVTIKVQRDTINAEWRQRFLAETGEEFLHLA